MKMNKDQEKIEKTKYFMTLTITLGILSGSGGFYWANLGMGSTPFSLFIGLLVAVLTTNILNSYEVHK